MDEPLPEDKPRDVHSEHFLVRAYHDANAAHRRSPLVKALDAICIAAAGAYSIKAKDNPWPVDFLAMLGGGAAAWMAVYTYSAIVAPLKQRNDARTSLKNQQPSMPTTVAVAPSRYPWVEQGRGPAPYEIESVMGELAKGLGMLLDRMPDFETPGADPSDGGWESEAIRINNAIDQLAANLPTETRVRLCSPTGKSTRKPIPSWSYREQMIQRLHVLEVGLAEARTHLVPTPQEFMEALKAAAPDLMALTDKEQGAAAPAAPSDPDDIQGAFLQLEYESWPFHSGSDRLYMNAADFLLKFGNSFGSEDFTIEQAMKALGKPLVWPNQWTIAPPDSDDGKLALGSVRGIWKALRAAKVIERHGVGTEWTTGYGLSKLGVRVLHRLIQQANEGSRASF